MKTLVQMVEAFRIHEPRYVLPNMFTADLSTMVNPMSALSRGGRNGSNDIRVMADNLVKAHPDFRFVIMSDHKGQVTSAFENGVLTCCEYEED